MIRLAIDTSSALCSVALDCGDGRVLQHEQRVPDSHSQNLARQVEQLLQEARLVTFADIKQLVVGLGPGSFTGLRISLGYMKGVSWAQQIPLSGMLSFQAMAQAHISVAERFAVCSDAR